ncbi:MAG: hypothetical protein JKY65_01010 [Planctomycetes bacterium]|nr:hypothetical protein [Planctomycetota bacterium]
MRTARDTLAVLAAGALFAGCGAAIYGTAIAIVITQKTTKNIDTSFPDAVPTAPVTPPFATLSVSATMATVTRSDTGGFVVTASPGTQQITDLAVDGVNFPPGFGEARSNRDVDENLVVGDKLFLRINQDTVQSFTIAAGEVAAIGSAVAAAIQSKVRVLTPVQTSIPVEAYSQFTARFDSTSRSYVFESGAPGQDSEVVWQPAPRTGTTDPPLDAQSEVTGARLGFGLTNGGLEIAGADSVRFQVLNRGDDVIAQGTKIQLYFSLDKDLSLADDILFDEIDVPETIAVGESRLIRRRNGNALPIPLVRGDFKDSTYFVLFSVAVAGGELVTNNNVAFTLGTISLYQPIDDPTTTPVETALTLDFAPTRLTTPIGLVAGDNLAATVGIMNLGENVVPAGTVVDLELTLSADTTFSPPAAFQDPARVLAGIRINPRSPNRAAKIVVDPAGAGPLTATVFADTITIAFNSGGGVATVQSMIVALNGSLGNLVEAFHDGRGSTTELLNPLVTASGVTEQTASDLFVVSQRITFTQTTRPQEERTFLLNGIVRNALDTTALPSKLRPFLRIRPVLAAGSGGEVENTKNNVRRGRNFMRLYDRATAFFDPDTGIKLPTRGANDFAKLDAVTQRPVNTGSIQQGQQRVFSFTIPITGSAVEESQLLIVLRSADFDAHLDLLSGTGQFLAGSDDELGKDPVVYSPALAAGSNLTFYLVVSPARFDEADLSGGDETFELTISANSRGLTDPALLIATKADNILDDVNQRFDPPATSPRIENNSILAFSLANRRSEVMFVLPQRARVRFRSTPIANSGITTTITQFLQGQVPSPVSFQAQFEPAEGKIIYRPTGKGANASHLLQAGVYTLAFDGSLSDAQKFRLEIDTEFVPDSVIE